VNETSTQLERRAERARERLADNLAELRDNVSPARLVSDIFDIDPRKWRVDDAARLLIEQVRLNPIACTLIAAGIGLLVYSDRNVQRARQSINPINHRRRAPQRRFRHRKGKTPASSAR
jgi:hypothetical protein